MPERSPFPSTFDQASFWAKSRLLIGARLVRNAAAGEPFRPLRRISELPEGARLLARDETRLYSVTDPRERELELGKVQNLRVAAAAVDDPLREVAVVDAMAERDAVERVAALHAVRVGDGRYWRRGFASRRRAAEAAILDRRGTRRCASREERGQDQARDSVR